MLLDPAVAFLLGAYCLH